VELGQEQLMFAKIFWPDAMDQTIEVEKDGRRFAYYTTAETAIKVFRNKELWFRNATVMNDYSEIAYGIRMTSQVMDGQEGVRFKKAVSDIFLGIMKRVGENFERSKFDWHSETYLACISLHDDKEDTMGRLSMWRAYGDTAIIINNTPLTAVTGDLGVYSMPVQYLDIDMLTERLAAVTNEVLINRTYLEGLGEDVLVNNIHHMLFQYAIGTKHPGFTEEQEWRLYYRPNQQDSPMMTPKIEVIQGTPQKIWALRLEHNPDIGLHGADLPSLLDRLIVGPSAHPFVARKALIEVLQKADVTNAAEKVIISDIPLRT
jgi:hypothetical protein